MINERTGIERRESGCCSPVLDQPLKARVAPEWGKAGSIWYRPGET